MSSIEKDTNYADIDNLDNIIMVANVGAPAISDLSPNSDWKSYSHGTLNSCYGLPYQDHNYGAPPPPTPPPSPGKVTVSRKKSVQPAVVRSIKVSKSLSEKKSKPPPSSTKKQAGVRRRNSAPVNKSSTTPVKSEAVDASPTVEPVVNVVEEVTESPPIVGDYSDSVTRCICNFTHDDGYMICCDQCQVWQHIDCMGIERESIPEEYSCEQCMPRKVSKLRARMIQKQKREEIFKSSSEDENSNSKAHPNMSSCSSPPTKDSPSDMPKRPPLKSRNKKTSGIHNDFINGRKKATTDDCITSQQQQLRSSKRLSRASADTMFLSVDGDAEDSPWTAPYEVATMNQYSTDVEESLKSYKTSDTKQQAGNGVLAELATPKCQLRLLVNGRRGLEVDRTISPSEALIEFKGKVMLQQQYQQENSLTKRPQPFVLFYNKWEEMDLCVDATSFGNAARFVRRSCVPNAEVRHMIENGQLHLVLYAVKEMNAASEVTIPFDYDFKSCEYCVECACVRAQCPVRKAARKLIKSLSNGSGDVHRFDQSKSAPATPAPSQTPLKNECTDEVQVEISSPDHSDKTSKSGKGDTAMKSPNSDSQDAKPMSREQRKIEAYMKAFEKMEKREERRREALQRINEKRDNSNSEEVPETQPETKTTSAANVTTTVEQKRKPVPKAPAARRRRNKSGPVVRRRTTSSTNSQPVSEEENSNGTFADSHAAGDSILPPSTRIPTPAEVGSTCVGTIGSLSTSGFRFPKTKKDLLSNWYHEKGLDKPVMTGMQTPEKQTSTSISVDKPLSIQTSMTPATNDDDNIDFVITNPSPGSTFAHLRRNSISINQNSHHVGGAQRKLDTSLGSAKKRWLKQAMEEGDVSGLSCPASLISPTSRQSSPTNTQTVHSATAPSSTVVSPSPLSPSGAPTAPSTTTSCDFVTPLKKRRLMRESLSVDEHPMSPELAGPSVVPNVSSQQKISFAQQLPTITNTDVPAIDMTAIARRPATPTKEPTPTTSADSSPEVETHSTSLLDQTDAVADSIIAPPEPPMSAEPSGMQTEKDYNQDSKDSNQNNPTSVEEVCQGETTVSSDLISTTITEQIPATVSELPPITPAQTPAHTAACLKVVEVDEPAPLPLPVEVMRDSYRPLAAAVPQPSPSNQYMAFQLPPPPPQLIMSPAEPRTLSDMLSKSAACKSLSIEDTSEPLNDAVTESMNFETGNRSHCLQSMAVTSVISPNKLTSAVKRPASLVEQVSETDGAVAEGCLSPSSCKMSPDSGSSPAAEGSTSPAQRKKVSLLEYRKRMKVKVTSSSTASTTAISATTSLSRLASANKCILQPISLPSLPLFQPVPILPKPDPTPRPVIKSLNDRLAQEFGVGTTCDTNSHDDTEDGERTPPPPPPPPLPSEDSGKPLSTKNLTNMYNNSSHKNGTIGPLGTGTTISSVSPSQQATKVEGGPVNGLDNRNSSPSFLLKQGSLGAVMLGHSSSPVMEPSDSIVKEIQETKLRRDYNLPKKYQHTAADIHR